ncbi:hypothetical protein A9Y58_00269 [Streptococcus parauberis]|uniref:hypothetical protein n=1 Tax=Streptococcus parauberis TaxID=1348 RepID=UPI0009754895|nr:hypothetical protein [Streptococcus parauberis]ONH63703.1 hypothetical protein ASN87_01011 [Streptococcus parauberis]PCH14344.1 hypothetical protein A9Y58_00269 [Streptococcus parauberis]
MLQKFDGIIQHLPKLPKWVWFIIYFLMIAPLSDVLPDGLLFTAMIGLGLGFNYVGKRKKWLTGQKLAKRIQNLKDNVHLADKQSNLLKDYLAISDYSNFKVTAEQLLARIEYIKDESYNLQSHIPRDVYSRMNQKADDVKVDTVLQLEKLQQISGPQAEHTDLHLQIVQEAPEINDLYKNIQKDHHNILEKIKKADNVAELEALHESGMQKFYDILDGYLKIKASPKDYYNAEQRLENALVAIKAFDLDLDETLRQLNESDLSDFDISLRMMQTNKRTPDSDTTI